MLFIVMNALENRVVNLKQRNSRSLLKRPDNVIIQFDVLM